MGLFFSSFSPIICLKNLSRETHGRVGHPPDGVFKQMIGEKELKNNPVSLDDVANALAIFDANVNRLKGAVTRKKPHRVGGEM